MTRQIGLLALAGLLLSGDFAIAAMPIPMSGQSTSVTSTSIEPVALRRRHGIRGTVHPGHKTHIPSYLTQMNPYPKYLYNDPPTFNPSEPPVYDGLRQDYPGLGLYR